MENDLRNKNFSAFVDKIRALPQKQKVNGLILCFMTDSRNDDKCFLTDDEALSIIESVKDIVDIPHLVGDWGQPDTAIWICAMGAGHFKTAKRLMELGYPMTNLLDPRQDYAESWIKALVMHVTPISGIFNREAESFWCKIRTTPQLSQLFVKIMRWACLSQTMQARQGVTMAWRLDPKISAEMRQDRQNREYPFFLRSCSIAQLNSYMMP